MAAAPEQAANHLQGSHIQNVQPHFVTPSLWNLTYCWDHDVRPPPSRLQIVYRDLTYSVNVKNKGGGSVRKLILKGLSGVIQPGRVTYVMWVQ